MSSERGDSPEPYLIRGNWRYRPVRSHHERIKRCASAVANQLNAWHSRLPKQQFEILTHRWFQLRTFPPTVSCFPLAVVRDLVPSQGNDWIPGLPLIAVEVFAGADRYGDLWERVAEYADCGVPAVWVFTPTDKTVTVHRPTGEVHAYDSYGAFAGDPELPGFSCPVADFFR